MTEKRILLVRSSGMTFERAVNYLCQKYPEAQIHLLVTPGSYKKYQDREEFAEAFKTEQNSYRVNSLNQKTKKQMKKNNYEQAYLLYNYDKSADYADVEALLREIKPNQIIGLTYYLETHPLNLAGFYYRFWRNKLETFILTVINWLIYLLAWTFALAGMSLIRLRGSHKGPGNFETEANNQLGG
jgi:hypothetical protein